MAHAGEKVRFGFAGALKLFVERLELLGGLALVVCRGGAVPGSSGSCERAKAPNSSRFGTVDKSMLKSLAPTWPGTLAPPAQAR